MIIGEQSAGAVLKQKGQKITGGGLLHYSTHDFTSSKGQRVEGRGIIPDKAVRASLPDLRSSRDTVLEEATDSLANAVR
jgi:C-terminal processing protease CtpA/Prc